MTAQKVPGLAVKAKDYCAPAGAAGYIVTTGLFEDGFAFVAGASPGLFSSAVWAAAPFLNV